MGTATSENPQSFFMLSAVILGAGSGMVFGARAVVLPLRAGIKALREMEF
jgi:hypothetical protein